MAGAAQVLNAGLIVGALAAAQDYPARPIRMVIPFSAGAAAAQGADHR